MYVQELLAKLCYFATQKSMFWETCGANQNSSIQFLLTLKEIFVNVCLLASLAAITKSIMQMIINFVSFCLSATAFLLHKSFCGSFLGMAFCDYLAFIKRYTNFWLKSREQILPIIRDLHHHLYCTLLVSIFLRLNGNYNKLIKFR